MNKWNTNTNTKRVCVRAVANRLIDGTNKSETFALIV